MTIAECIAKVDNLYPNQYSEETKVAWLSYLDCQIFTDIILTHEHRLPHPHRIKAVSNENPLDIDTDKKPRFPKPKFKPYSTEDMTQKLIAPFPYEELYFFYLHMKIDEANNETIQYNNSVAQFNSYYENFAKHYNEEHMPINTARYNMWRH